MKGELNEVRLLIGIFIVAVIILAADIVLESYWSWNVAQANKRAEAKKTV